jgi:hypothetical protein
MAISRSFKTTTPTKVQVKEATMVKSGLKFLTLSFHSLRLNLSIPPLLLRGRNQAKRRRAITLL